MDFEINYRRNRPISNNVLNLMYLYLGPSDEGDDYILAKVSYIFKTDILSIEHTFLLDIYYNELDDYFKPINVIEQDGYFSLFSINSNDDSDTFIKLDIGVCEEAIMEQSNLIQSYRDHIPYIENEENYENTIR